MSPLHFLLAQGIFGAGVIVSTTYSQLRYPLRERGLTSGCAERPGITSAHRGIGPKMHCGTHTPKTVVFK
jgi:hypothetical protein